MKFPGLNLGELYRRLGERIAGQTYPEVAAAIVPTVLVADVSQLASALPVPEGDVPLNQNAVVGQFTSAGVHAGIVPVCVDWFIAFDRAGATPTVPTIFEYGIVAPPVTGATFVDSGNIRSNIPGRPLRCNGWRRADAISINAGVHTFFLTIHELLANATAMPPTIRGRIYVPPSHYFFVENTVAGQGIKGTLHVREPWASDDSSQ